jgi:Domain of unknown function (DUF4326)
MTTKVVNRRLIGIQFDIDVTRPSIWSNPFAVDKGKPTAAKFIVKTLSEALRGYEDHLASDQKLVDRARKELRGLTLGCWCCMDLTGKAPIICHAQILARVADGRKLPILPRRP